MSSSLGGFSFSVGRSVSGFLVVAQEAGLFVGWNTFGAEVLHPFNPLLPGPQWNWFLALGEPVVPWHVWISSMKLLEFLQAAY